MHDDARDTLLRPWRLEAPDLPGAARALFLGARWLDDLDTFLPWSQVTSVQPHAPWAAELTARGLTVHPTADDLSVDGVDVALCLLDQDADAARARLARAVLALRPGGELLVSTPNRLGGKRYAKWLRKVVGPLWQDSKKRCRVVWLERPADLDVAPLEEAVAQGAQRPVLGGAFQARPGVFGWDKEDRGSKLLVEHLPARLGRSAADLGAGYGYLTRAILARAEGLERLEVLEADARALAGLAAARPSWGHPELEVGLHWVDATARWPGHRVQTVVTNPPFHVGGKTDVELGRAFVDAAARMLVDSGDLWLVANRQLPYERTLSQRFRHVEAVAERDGFKVLHARFVQGR